MRVAFGLVATFIVFATTDGGSWTRFFLGLALVLVVVPYLAREVRADRKRRTP